MAYTQSECRMLLRIARESILRGLTSQPHEVLPSDVSVLDELHGVFVTIRMGGELRGCIGYVEPHLPLGETLQEVAQKAAFQDPRFPEMTEQELSVAEIEVSVLSPIERVENINEIEIGKHGLVIEAGASRGLLLPQVAISYQWNREQFLNNTSLKAGLSSSGWKKSGIVIYKFSTETFSDHAHSS